MIYKRGDMHGESAGVAAFCTWKETTAADTLIILGDAGINGADPERDEQLKRFLSALPITLFCIHGNHDRRPSDIPSYQEMLWNNGLCYREERYPNLIFAKDGEIYNLGDRETLVIGGAASSDKYYRLAHGLPWWENEMPSDAVKHRTEENLSACGWKVDQVLSHTLPLKYVPADRLASCMKSGNPDLSTERWLEQLEQRMSYRRWSAGHWHADVRVNEKVEVLYREYQRF